MERRVRCECGREFVVAEGSTATSLDCPACGREVSVPRELASLALAPSAPAGPQPDKKPCPFCLEPIHPEARKCPFCQEYLDKALARPSGVPTSGLAVGALVLGALAPFACFTTGPPAVLLGIAGLLATRGGRARGKRMAIIGLLLGLLWTGLFAGLVALVIWGGASAPLSPSPGEPLF